MKRYIAVIDQGTSSTRCIIFDENRQITSVDQHEHRQFYPKPGWVEHDPIEILNNSKLSLSNAIKTAKLQKEDIAAIGITNQRETTFVWNRNTGLPVYNAIVWQDTRTDGICDELAKFGGQNRFQEKTGLPLATYFSGPKIQWILDNVPDARRLAEKGDLLFGTADTWLLWNLTGGIHGGLHQTDITNASRTLLMDLHSLKWDDEIIKDLNIPSVMLPEIKPSSHLFGTAKGEFDGLRIASILGDQQAALFGQTCYGIGEAKNTYGTGCFMLMNTGEKKIISEHGLLTTPGYQLEGQPPVYCLEGSIAITGALVQWLRDNLHLIQSSSEIEQLARSVPDNGDVYIVPAFSGLFAPYWRSDARGVMTGLTRFASAGHIARAVLEATAYQTQEVLEAMTLDSGVKLTELKVDGGMVLNDLLMQFQADILRVPVIRPKITETTALGAAYAAGLAVGVWENQESLKEFWKMDKAWLPEMANERSELLIKKWKKAVERSLNWIDPE